MMDNNRKDKKKEEGEEGIDFFKAIVDIMKEYSDSANVDEKSQDAEDELKRQRDRLRMKSKP